MHAKRRVRRVQPDDPITADDRNYLAEEIERCMPVAGKGVTVEPTSLGVTISAIPYGGIIGAYTPSGGISAATADASTPPIITPGSASCQIYVFANLLWKYAGFSRTVYNDMTSAAVAEAKFILCAESGDGALHALAEPC